jgi:tetratricopeptide (TPR) repeat protein
LLLAQFYVQWNKPDKAYELVKNLAEKLPQDIPLKRRLLACEQVIKDPAKAQQLVNEIKAIEGEDGWQWRYEQARLWFAGQDFKARYPQITSLLQENLLANPDDQASRALLAATYDRGGELRLAISTYREALSRSPDDLRIIIPAVAALYRSGESNEADEILRRAADRKLYHPQLEALRLERHLRRGELGAASDILEDLFTNDPNNRAACLSLALLKMQQNKFDEAEPLLNKLKTQEPNSLAVASAQIKMNILQKKPQEAIRLCDEIVNNLKNASAYILRARANAELGQADKAIEDLDRATSIEPNSIEAWTAKSDFHRSAGQSGKAVDCLQQAMSLAPDNIQIQKRLIPLLLGSADRGKVQQGKALLDKALQSSPVDIDLRLFKARSWLGEGTAPAIANAEKNLQQITEQQPQISEAWLLLGEISLSRGEPAKAADAAMRGLTHRRNDRALLLLKASADAARSPIFAIPTLKALYELDPNDVDIAVRLARTYIAADQAENAVKLLQKRPASSGNTLEQRRLNTALAVALYKNGDKEEAQKKLDLLVQSDPNDPGPLLAQVQLLAEDEIWDQLNQKVTDWQQKHPQDAATPLSIAAYLVTTDNSRAREIAEAVLRATLQDNPNSQETMVNLAILLYTTSRPAEAVPLYRRAIQVAPENLVALNNLAWIMCEEQGEYQQALALAEKGLKIAPQYIDLIDTRGMIHYRLGQFEKAIADFTKCLELYLDTAPAKVASRFHLARALNRNGQPTEALKQLNLALDLHKQKQIGGLSPADLVEAQRLLEQLQKKGS